MGTFGTVVVDLIVLISLFFYLALRPLSMFANEGFIILLGLFQRWQQLRFSAVSGGDGDIAQVTAPPGAFERAILEFLVEFPRREFQFFSQ